MGKNIIAGDLERITKGMDFHMLNGKKVLVTGATGLIGSYLLQTIESVRDTFVDCPLVYVVVHNSLPQWLDFTKTQDNYVILQGDLSDFEFLNSLPKVDVIIHAAGYGQPGMFLTDKIKTLRINTLATDQLFLKLNEKGIYLFLSSSEIYSGSSNTPYDENDAGVTSPQHNRACYIEGKRCGEAVCMAYREKGINVKIARVSLAYGPCFKQGDKRVLNNFIEKSIRGDIDMLDAGEAKRVYCYISDTVEMLWHILLEGKDTVYNVGGEEETTIRNLANLVANNSGVNVIVPVSDNGMKDAPIAVAMSVEKVRNEFKKTEFISLEEGIKRTIEWYNNEYCQR